MIKPGFILPTPTLPGPDLGEFKIKQHEKYPNMYWVVYPDGSLSKDFYNKTRATDHCVTLASKQDASKRGREAR